MNHEASFRGLWPSKSLTRDGGDVPEKRQVSHRRNAVVAVIVDNTNLAGCDFVKQMNGGSTILCVYPERITAEAVPAMT